MSTIERRLRGLLLAILIFGMFGTGVELLLLEHTEGISQLTPILLLAVGIGSASVVGFKPSAGSLRLLQGLMLLFLVSGAVGLYLHYRGNVEFELEMYPTMSGFELFKESMTGATPALAPGTMAMLGLIGLAFSYGHPQTRNPMNTPSSSEEGDLT